MICFLALQAVVQAIFLVVGMLFLRTEHVLSFFWCLSIYLLQNFSLKRMHYGTERTYNGGKEFPKSFQRIQKVCKIFLWKWWAMSPKKNQNPQHWKQPLLRSLLYVSITISWTCRNSSQSLIWVSTYSNIPGNSQVFLVDKAFGVIICQKIHYTWLLYELSLWIEMVEYLPSDLYLSHSADVDMEVN